MPRKTVWIKRRKAIKHSNGRTNLIAVLALTAVLSGFLLFFTNARQQEQLEASYCGDFGFYGKWLTLMKNHEFIFSYYGYSQSRGRSSRIWAIKDSVLTLLPRHDIDVLTSQYHMLGYDLIPLKGESEKFTLCEKYIDPFERIIIE